MPLYTSIKKFKKKKLYLFCLSLTLTACQSWYGPSALNDTHGSYNQAIVNSLSQEMLLNLVRLKYRDRPYFLSINSVTASMSLKSSLGLNSSSSTSGTSVVSPDIGISFSQSPTISYAPLGGEDFLKSVLSPVSFEAVLIMAQSGWSMERIFGLCIERINTLNNAPSASGPTPEYEPRYKQFYKFLTSLTYLHKHNLIEVGSNPKTGKGIEVHLANTNNPQEKIEIEKIRRLLKLNDSAHYHFSTNFLAPTDKSWTLRLRSISGILYYLSQNIEVPKEHKERGLVTNTLTTDGAVFDWEKTPAGALFKIQSSSDKPSNAYLSVFYRDTWFYIADNDLNSKATFMLLTQLFNLQAGQQKVLGPTLTLPVGR